MEWLLLPVVVLWIVCAAVTCVTWAVHVCVRGEPVQFRTATVSMLARGSAVRLLMNLMWPLAWWSNAPGPRPSQTRHRGAPRPPVLLMHGYGRHRAALFFLQSWLRSRGWRWVWPINSKTSPRELADIPQMARAFVRHVDRLAAAAGVDKIDVVAHSMGGIVATWAINNLDCGHRIRTLVTLGTPWQGTRLAVFTRDTAGLALLPGSEFLATLGPPPPGTVCITSSEDAMVIPPSAAPPGATSHELRNLGHTELITSRVAFEMIEAALTGRDEE